MPLATELAIWGSAISTYCTSVNPSPRSSSSAMYSWARQIAGTLAMRIRLVSGGGSAAAGSGFHGEPGRSRHGQPTQELPSAQ